MATGTSTKITGQIGEHLVSAMLGHKGFYASPFSGNVPLFDLIAIHGKTLKSFPIQVKASNSGALVQSTIDKWCKHSIGEDNHQEIGALTELEHPDMIWIIVRLSNNSLMDTRFFICTTQQIQERIVRRYRNFMERHNYRRPGGGGSKQAILDIVDLLEFENNWGILPST